MAFTLSLGVVDLPYSTPPAADGQPAKKAVTVTTGQVAQWLENKYHPLEIFYRQNEEKIGGQIADSLAGALENVLSGAPTETAAPFAEAESAIAEEFRQFLALDVMASLGYPGVPTQAALDGVNHRLKAKKGAPRPSFIDTSLYSNSMRSWVD